MLILLIHTISALTFNPIIHFSQLWAINILNKSFWHFSGWLWPTQHWIHWFTSAWMQSNRNCLFKLLDLINSIYLDLDFIWRKYASRSYKYFQKFMKEIGQMTVHHLLKTTGNAFEMNSGTWVYIEESNHVLHIYFTSYQPLHLIKLRVESI